MTESTPILKKSLSIHIPCLVASAIVGLVIFILFATKGCLWFGNTTLATQDAYYQYVDFLSWYKDLFAGKHSLNYTFTKELGGTAIPFFAYYLASPLNALFLLFPKEKAPAFIDMLFAIKSVIAAYCFSYYVKKRFVDIRTVFTIVLGISYGLMEYNIAQSFNMMWLDGVYMLPIMLLGIYYCVNEKRIVPLAVATGITVLLNWYTGGINCLFSLIWFFYEESELLHGKLDSFQRRRLFNDICRFFLSMSLGVLLSSCLFVPSIIALRSGEGSSFDWSSVHSSFMGNLYSAIENHTIGAYSESGSVALFCGSLALLAVIHFFRNCSVVFSDKIKCGLLLLFGVLSYYYEPLFFAFSLFKSGEGYWYRYSYLGCFIILFIAAKGLNRFDTDNNNRNQFIVEGIGLSAALLLLAYVNPKWNLNHVYATTAFVLLIAFLFPIEKKNKLHITIGNISIVVVCAAELFFNASYLVDSYMMDNGSEYAGYICNLEESINDIKTIDDGYYRISQTFHRQGNLSYSSTVNDSMAVGFMGISGYSSLSENIQTDLESNMGYNCWGGNLQVVLTSIIPTDSLLGVNYIISNYPIQGLVDIGDSPLSPECRLYENPYSLPIVFSVDGSAYDTGLDEFSNPFEFVNSMYSNLVGRRVEVFKPIVTEYSSIGNADCFNINVVVDDAVYGYVDNPLYGAVKINGSDWIHVGEWQAQTLFYVPVWSDQGCLSITIESETPGVFAGTRFYRIDFEELQCVIQSLRVNDSVENLIIEDGYVSCEVNVSNSEYLQTSIPSADGWTAYVNGNITDIIAFADGLIRIPLQEGDNTVVLRYKTPGITIGIIVSLITLVAITFIGIIEHRRRPNQ